MHPNLKIPAQALNTLREMIGKELFEGALPVVTDQLQNSYQTCLKCLLERLGLLD